MEKDEQDKELPQAFETLMLHAGQEPDPTTKARSVPIQATTSQNFSSCENASNLFALKEFGNIYTRIMNPTNDVFEKRMAALEGGTAAVAFASGQSAILTTVLMLCQRGDNLVSMPELQGGTANMFKVTLSRLGIECRYVHDPKWKLSGKGLTEAEMISQLCDDNTKLVFCESICNPSQNVHDLDAFKRVCQEKQLPLVIDNTFGMGGQICRPAKFGCDIVVHSATKWIGGHGTSIGGVVVDAGTFLWDKKMSDGKPKFPMMTEPSPAQHGLKFQETFGPKGVVGANVAFAIRIRTEGLRDMGACMSPFNAFLFLQGLETLSLRADRTCQNANLLAIWLSDNPKITWVNHLGLEKHPSHANAKKYLRKDCYGGVLGFGIKGGKPACEAFINNLKLCSHLANVGDAKSLMIAPAITTHSQLSAEELTRAGITDDTVRLSVGYENVEDIKKDIEQALNAAKL